MSTTSATGVTIHIPTPLRVYTDGESAITVGGTTVGEAVAQLVEQHPALRNHLYSDQGKLRSFINFYLNDEDIRYLEQDGTSVSEGDTLYVVPSIAGG